MPIFENFSLRVLLTPPLVAATGATLDRDTTCRGCLGLKVGRPWIDFAVRQSFDFGTFWLFCGDAVRRFR